MTAQSEAWDPFEAYDRDHGIGVGYVPTIPTDLPDDPEHDGSSYRPVCMAKVKAGDVAPPSVLFGIDDLALFYPGRTNMLMAESEAGKTWLALHAAKQVIDSGGRVLVLDYEDEGATFKARMLALGVSESVIDDESRVVYVRPDGPLQDHRNGKATLEGVDFGALLEERFDLAIIDGVTDAMQLEGFDPNSNAELAIWNRMVPKRLALQTGAATVMLDHYGKIVGDPRYAIGGQHKRGMITGASYGLEVTEPIGRGKSGGGRFIVGKDRPGYVRGRSTKIDRGMLVAAAYSVDHDELTGRVLVRVEPFMSAATHSDELAVDMALVKALHAALEQAGVALSGRGWKGSVRGKDDRKQGAMDWLIGKGYVLKERVGRSDLHRPNPSKPKDW